MSFTSNNTIGCTDISHIASTYPSGAPIFHDASGLCYQYNKAGEIQFYAFYGYNPELSVGIVFTVLFGLLSLLYLALTVNHKPRWVIVTSVGALGETVGWIGRTLSASDNTASANAKQYFLIQIACLTFSPAFFSAACYGLFATIVARMQFQTEPRISARKLAYFFIACDIISLILQSAGGGIASGAQTLAKQATGTNMMVGGIAFQLVIMVVFSMFAIDWYYRLTTSLPRNLLNLFIGIMVASFLIIVRGAYRTAELSQGWQGYLITHESFFLGLDAIPMVLCMVALMTTHPRWTLPTTKEEDQEMA